MFDFAWSEIALIGVVALVMIGPKDMPVAIRAAARAMKKARRMAAEFQTHVDEMVREADLHEVRDGINTLRGANLRGIVERAVDSDGAIRRTLRDDPFADDPGRATMTGPRPPGPIGVSAPAGSEAGMEQGAIAPPPIGTARTVDLRPVHEIARPAELGDAETGHADGGHGAPPAPDASRSPVLPSPVPPSPAPPV